MTGAMRAIRSGDAIAAIYIPENFERDLLARQRPQIVTLYNRQYFTPGNNANSTISSAIAAATAALPRGGDGGGYRPGALVSEQYVLSNPALNYAQFLLRAILPTVLHVVIALAAGYAVGSEFSRRSKRAWMRAAGGRPLVALVGKLMPLFGLFVIMEVVVAVILHALYAVSFRGDPVMVAAAALLHILGYLGLGALLVLITQNLGSGLSLIAIFCNPAFGFAGVGFPIDAMNGFARAWGAILPLRWYLQVLFDQAARGAPPSDSVTPFMVLGGLACLYFFLAWLRLRAIAERRAVAPEPVDPGPVQDGRGVAIAFRNEAFRILGDRSVFGLIVLAPVLYGLLYPQPYLGEVLRSLPIAVVDQDHTELSRDFVEALNADQGLAVTARAGTPAEARAALDRHDVYAIVAIPKDTERQVLRGEQARIATYVDAAYLLLYSQTLQGISEAAATASAAVALRGARIDGSLAHAALVKTSPVESVSEPLFNPTGGYAAYVVPAAFVLILQQTLLLGVASIGGAAFESAGRASRRLRAGARAVFGQALAHVCFAVPGLALYLIVLPRVYGFSTLGRLEDLVLLAVPFALAVSFLAQFVGAWFRRRETAVLLLVAVSLPLFFLVGVSWPVEAIPDFVRAGSRAFPSTAAIDAFIRINQMGASILEVRRDWITLWVLAVVYGLIAVAATLIANRNGARS